MTISAELLAAYADGELEADAARAVAREIAADPVLQATLAAHLRLRARLAAHFMPITEAQVPDRLRQAVLAGAESTIVSPAEKRWRRPPVLPARWRQIALPALAASLVLALVGIEVWPSGDYARGDLVRALDSQLVATQDANAPVRILLSFRDRAGRYCRGFTSNVRSGIACRETRGWRLRRLLRGGAAGSGEYRQARSTDMALMAQAQEMSDGSALDASGEARAARQGWRAAPSP